MSSSYVSLVAVALTGTLAFGGLGLSMADAISDAAETEPLETTVSTAAQAGLASATLRKVGMVKDPERIMGAIRAADGFFDDTERKMLDRVVHVNLSLSGDPHMPIQAKLGSITATRRQYTNGPDHLPKWRWVEERVLDIAINERLANLDDLPAHIALAARSVSVDNAGLNMWSLIHAASLPSMPLAAGNFAHHIDDASTVGVTRAATSLAVLGAASLGASFGELLRRRRTPPALKGEVLQNLVDNIDVVRAEDWRNLSVRPEPEHWNRSINRFVVRQPDLYTNAVTFQRVNRNPVDFIKHIMDRARPQKF